MATQAAIRAVHSITDLAEMPYELARPILLKVQSPHQLHEIEINSPHIAEHSEELWKALIARDIPDWEKKMVYPKNPQSWHKVYRYLQRQEEKKAAEDEAALKKAVQGESLKRSNKEILVIKQVLPGDHDSLDVLDYYGKGGKGFRSRASGWSSGHAPTPTLKNAKTGQDAIAAIRRQTALASKQKVLSNPWRRPNPAQKLAMEKRQITAAPASMLSNPVRSQCPPPLVIAPRQLLPHEKSMLTEVRAAKAAARVIPPPRKVLAAQRDQKAVNATVDRLRAANEDKLRALTRPQRPTLDTNKSEIQPARSAGITETRRSAVPTIANTVAARAAVKRPIAMVEKHTVESSPGPLTNASSPVDSDNAPSTVKIIRKRPAQTSMFNTSKKRKV